MQIVIEIDEREWMDEKSIREVAFEYKKGSGFDRAIREGLRQAIVLPKGHGDLIDRNDLLEYTDINRSAYIPVINRYEIITAPTIIEAESERLHYD